MLISFRDVTGLLLVAAAGSTAFTVFGLPHNRTAKPRNVIGGHVICVVVGFACSFFMVLFDAEHPPAAGSALALVASPLLSGAVFVLASAFIFSSIRAALLPFLKDLY